VIPVRVRVRVRAVFFDAGATLLYPDPPVEEVYARVFSGDGARFTAGDLRDALAATWAAVQAEEKDGGDRYGGVRGEAEFWRAFLTRVRGLLDGGVVSPAAFERLAAHFRSREAWRVYPDVLPILEHLKAADVGLAVVSNWDSFLPRLLEGHGLSPFLQTVSVSAIEGTGKPEAEIFRRTCARLGVSPEEVLHVGDSPRDDYEGARGAGLRAVLLDRDDRHPHVAERIRSLSEIAGIAGRAARPDLIGSAPTS
jgi:putative hydrolase of the HAD superfamily